MRSASGTRIVPAPRGAEPDPPEEAVVRPVTLCACATRLLACGLLAAALSGCGGDETGSHARLPSGPPSWRALGSDEGGPGAGFALRANSPCRVRVRLVQDGQPPEEGSWVVLAAGQTRRLVWTVDAPHPVTGEDMAGPEDAGAGRSEAHAALVRFQFAESAVGERRFVFWTRPGRGRLLWTEAVPPGGLEALAWDTPIELVTVLVTDLAQGEAELLHRRPLNRMRLPHALAPGDRTAMVRVFLDYEPLAAGAS